MVDLFIKTFENTCFWSKPMAIVAYLYKNCDVESGIVFATYKKIEKGAHVSAPIIARVMKQLQRDGIVEKIQNGVWKIHFDKTPAYE